MGEVAHGEGKEGEKEDGEEGDKELGHEMFAEDGKADADDEEGDEGERDGIGAEDFGVGEVVEYSADQSCEGSGGVIGVKGVEDGEDGEIFDGGPFRGMGVGDAEEVGDLQSGHEVKKDKEGDPSH